MACVPARIRKAASVVEGRSIGCAARSPVWHGRSWSQSPEPASTCSRKKADHCRMRAQARLTPLRKPAGPRRRRSWTHCWQPRRPAGGGRRAAPARRSARPVPRWRQGGYPPPRHAPATAPCAWRAGARSCRCRCRRERTINVTLRLGQASCACARAGTTADSTADNPSAAAENSRWIAGGGTASWTSRAGRRPRRCRQARGASPAAARTCDGRPGLARTRSPVPGRRPRVGCQPRRRADARPTVRPRCWRAASCRISCVGLRAVRPTSGSQGAIAPPSPSTTSSKACSDGRPPVWMKRMRSPGANSPPRARPIRPAMILPV